MAWQQPGYQQPGYEQPGWGYEGGQQHYSIYNWQPAREWEEPEGNSLELIVTRVLFFGTLALTVPLFIWFTSKMCKEPKELPDQGILVRYDLLTGRVHFSDSWLEDFIFFSKNNHPLLGIFFCHPLHPYDKKERVLVLLSTSIVSTILVTLAEALMPKWAKWNRFFVTTVIINFPLICLNAFLAWMAVLPERLQAFGTLYKSIKPFLRCLICISKCIFYGTILFLLVSMAYQVTRVLKMAQAAGAEKKVGNFWTSLPAAFVNVLLTWVVWFVTKIITPFLGFGPPTVPGGCECMYKWPKEEMRPLGDPPAKIAEAAQKFEAAAEAASSGDSEYSEFSDEKE